jgi:type I restriction enzyme S subunit
MKIKEMFKDGLFSDGDWVESKDQDVNGDIRLIQLADIGDGKFIDKSNRFLNEETALKLKCTFLKQDDILVARMPDPLGRSCIFPFSEENRYVTVVDVCILRTPNNNRILPKYVSYNLNSSCVRHNINQQISGATRSRITKTKLGEIDIPLPPLEEQKRIAAILDAADLHRQKTKDLIAKYDELSQALFLDMFGDPVANPMGWETKTIEEIVKKVKGAIKRGPFGGALKKEIFVNDGYLVYEQFHALNNDFKFERYYINEEKFLELQGFAVKPKDIIISCSGVYLGKLAIIPNNAKPGIINQALLKITLDETKMVNQFFVKHFTHKNFRDKYFDANRGAGIPNFPPISEFKKFPFICPPLNKQLDYLDKAQKIEHQKSQAEQNLHKAEELFQSLLQKAFKGEL